MVILPYIGKNSELQLRVYVGNIRHFEDDPDHTSIACKNFDYIRKKNKYHRRKTRDVSARERNP